MPFYRWDDMKKRNIVPTTDSEGSMILGAFTTLTRQEQPPGKATRPHSHGQHDLGRGRGGPHTLRGGARTQKPRC